MHEAGLRLARAGASADCSPSQLLAAAEQPGRALIDHARTRVRIKRGVTHARPLTLDAVELATSSHSAGILAVDEAIRRLN